MYRTGFKIIKIPKKYNKDKNIKDPKNKAHKKLNKSYFHSS